VLVVLDRDLKVMDFKAFPGEAVDNSIAVGEPNGIYLEGKLNVKPKLARPTRRKRWDF
jgi:hypothetical protein